MKIAVTYDEQTGEVFQHFGHSDAFKIYEFDESGLTGAMVLNTSAEASARVRCWRSVKKESLLCRE